MSEHDRTFHPESLFGSIEWTAQRLGLTKDSFFRKRETLEADGFPHRDPLLNRYLKADVDAWIENRSRVPHTVAASDDPNFGEI